MSSKARKSRAASVLLKVRALPATRGGALAVMPEAEDYLMRKPSVVSLRAAQLMVGAFVPDDPGRLRRLANDLDRLRAVVTEGAADPQDRALA